MSVETTPAKSANSLHPQVVTFLIDDSGSMSIGNKARDVNEALQSLKLTLETSNFGATGSRFFINAAKFGGAVTPIAEFARPQDLDEKKLMITGASGGTNMPAVLEWAVGALESSLNLCRKIGGYQEAASPNPVVVFLTDGDNTHGDVASAAAKLKNIRFLGGPIDVLAIGVEMSPTGYATMQQIASRPEFAFNINPAQIHEILAAVEATMVESDFSLRDVADKY